MCRAEMRPADLPESTSDTVDCDTPERAEEIAARWPDARYFAMEVRPVMYSSGDEM